jgi:transmembrane sensor
MNNFGNFEARRRARKITEQAAAWYLEQQDNPSQRQQTAFLTWLRASPAHVAEYLAIAQMHGDMKAAAAIETMSMMELSEQVRRETSVVAFPRVTPPAPDTQQASGSRGHLIRRLAAVAALVVLGLLGAWHPWSSVGGAVQQSYAAGQEGIKEVNLPDGSLVHLAQNSMIDVRFDAHARRIEVVRGNALFDVGKDPKRPMFVSVGGHVLQDIGTVFDVQRETDGDTLTVISGRVRVWKASNAWVGKLKAYVGAPQTSGDAEADLVAGQQVQLRASSAGAIHAAAIAKTTDWLPADIRFQHETVGEVARRFNAYTSTPLVIDDPQLAGVRISGVFHANNPAAFVAYLATFPGVSVVRDSDRVRIVAASEVGRAALR